MGQFQHKHIVSLCGVVLEGQPIMAVLEYMANGDVRQYLQFIRHNGLDQFDNLASRLLNMAREIAEGMKYLSKKCFIHRDLAARNVMLDDQLTCKIGDFGMSRDLAEDTYYITHGGKIPIRWTAPEAVVYKKYSTASDVWSYGIVLYEMWTIGEKPYGYSWSNNDVIEMLEKGYRLSPPPGCSRPVYELMISCWHPDHHQRPSFHDVTVRLAASNDGLLSNRATSEPIRGCLGDCLDDAAGTYLDLQETYSKVK
ncbi:ephrin type-A receptor 8-like [Corticium candelabrum]|uniref:ephrin type-A receptor 8-like n=1 Tax=Corticium candelabrum TaxID=121492 RepID=UPI002E253D26|nr:ephrin type-A receptor 8-like [Corticium candelabrum]